MLLAAFFGWWYGAGWKNQVSRIKGTLRRVNDTFSIPLLLRTLFAPFRQISADDGGQSIGEKFNAMINRLFSRCIGAFMRIFMILFGVIALIGVIILSLVRLLIWPIMPLSPVVGVIVAITIGVPWS